MRSTVAFFVCCAAFAAESSKFDMMRAAVAREGMRTQQLVDRPDLAGYLDPLTKKVVAAMPGLPAWNWSARVTETAWPEPRLLPDGTILLPVPVLRKVRTEAELAACIAHAVAHQAMFRLVEREGTTIGMFYGDSDFFPKAMIPARQAMEQKADADTVEALRKAGYDPTAWNDLFARLRLQRDIDEGRNPIAESVPNAVVDTAAFHQFREQLNDLLTLPKPKVPSLRNAVRRQNPAEE